MTNYLFIFTIGPVQTFISQARKTQDLYAGSSLLSELITTAIDTFFKHEDNDNVIFPDFKTKQKPNRFMASIKKSKPDKLGRDIEISVKNRFQEISEQVLRKFDIKKPPLNYNEQIDNFLQINWSVIPTNENNFLEYYKKAEKILGTVKNIRDFKQITNEDKRKCSLCGERNALFFGNQERFPAYTQEDAIKVNSDKIALNEGLCAICFTKRFYKQEEFASTAKICLMETLQTLEKDNHSKELIDKYESSFKGRFEEQLYFEENLDNKYFEKNFINTSQDKNQLIKQLEEIKKRDKDLKFSSYYAVIAFDGDSMGKWLSGEFLENKNKLPEFQKLLSKTLGDFANDAEKYLGSPRGRAVYAGGDDFLGFININHLFEVMKDLREKFSDCVKPLSEYTKEKSELTFSAGIAIAHYKAPLSEVLGWARSMEKNAKEKNTKEKNAFSIAVLKHSGEIHQTCFKWKLENNYVVSILEEITENLKQEYFSRTFITNLNVEISKLQDKKLQSSSYEKTTLEIINSEIERLVKKSFIENNYNGKNKQEQVNEMIDNVKKLFSYSDTIDNFLSALNICTFLKRHLNSEKVRNNDN